jgi:rhamnogalacturonan endolyase
MKFLFLAFLIAATGTTQITAQAIKVKETDQAITVSNTVISFSFNKTNADLTQIGFEKYTNLLGKKGRGYLLGPGFSMFPCKFSIVRQTDSLIELSFLHEADNHFQYELHYILQNNESGIYCFLYQSHLAGSPVALYGQTRWGLSADEKLFNYHLVRDSIQGPMPAMSELTENNKVQDWTFRMPDSSYYTKYDYADYIENRHVHGFAGTNSGLGIFTIQASHEYLNGGPTKQFQNVHSTPYLINMFNCDHFLSDKRKDDDSIIGEWAKLTGPFFLYVNHGKNIDEIWKDAKVQSQKEIAQWPYAWMRHPDYPLKNERGELNGKITIPLSKLTANAHIILAAPDRDWQAQSQGYIYYTIADAKGHFQIKNIREGSYCLYAYTDNVMEEFVKEDILIKPKATTLLGTLIWSPLSEGKKLWQIGVADRTTKGFKLSDHKRNYGLFNIPPANLDFIIGKSQESKDWYYAQTKPGSWNIIFHMDSIYSGNATLTLAIAGCAKNPRLEVVLNDQIIGTLYMGNDASVYRSAVLGGYYQKEEIKFTSTLIKKGTNTISLRLPNVKPGGGIMYDAIKLEVN